jgi:hypothetical protein
MCSDGTAEKGEVIVELLLVAVFLVSAAFGTAPAFADNTRLCNNRCASDDETTINNDNDVDNSVENNTTNNIDNDTAINNDNDVDNSVENNTTNNIDNNTTDNFDNDVESCTNTISGNNNTVNCP